MLSGPENSNSIRKDVDSLRSRGILFFPSQEAWGRGWGWGGWGRNREMGGGGGCMDGRYTQTGRTTLQEKLT